MLTIGQVKTAGFWVDGDPTCWQCAAEKLGPLYVARLDANFEDGDGTNAGCISAYDLGSIESNEAYECGERLREDGADDATVDQAIEDYHLECAGPCGRVWVGGDTWSEDATEKPERAPNDGVYLW